MSLALFICVLSISLTESVNGAQYLNTTFLSTLFGLTHAFGATVIVPLASIYTSLKSHKLDFSLDFLKLI